MDNHTIEKEDIQRLVAYGLRSEWVRHVILKIESQEKTRIFISQIHDKNLISSAGGDWDKEADTSRWKLNVSFTYQGLQQLELNKQILSQTLPGLARSFTQGATERAQVQGDVGASAPYNWELGFQPDNAHLVLTIYGNESTSSWNEIQETLRSLDGSDGLTGWENVHLARKREGDKEVFGFKDGISQPFFRGVSKEPPGPIPESLKFEPGDLLLGYANNIGENFWDDDLLPNDSTNFFRNGTFAALKKIKQDLEKFNSVTEELAKEHDGVTPEYIRAKMFGRWPNGAVIKPGEKAQPEQPSAENENAFDFSDDKHGYGCPLGSHMRRINHRNTRDVFPNQHRAIQRRGLPYGGEDGEEEGLLALFICASLEKQFEFVMGDWVEAAPRTISGARALTCDPVIGNQSNGVKEFYIPRESDSIKLAGLRDFTTTRGMLYLFYPSMTALRRMAILDESNGEYVYSKVTNCEDYLYQTGS